MKVIMPMAGRGSRFREEGLDLPKPLVPVAGLPMFVRALASLGEDRESEVIFVALREHDDNYDLQGLILRHVRNPSRLVLIDDVTEGQLCTVLAARHELPADEDLLVMSADTVVTSDLAADIRTKSDDCAGIISTCDLEGEQWSFAQTDAEGRVIRVAEKVRISPHASTGLYYFSKAGVFLAYADQLIAERQKTRGEYYVIPIYQKYIDDGFLVTRSESTALWDMGTPAAKRLFEAHLESAG